MKYKHYIKYLKSNNIILFDHDYRISLNNVNNYLNNTSQTGGGKINKNNLLIFNKEELQMIINISLSSNPHYLLNLPKH